MVHVQLVNRARTSSKSTTPLPLRSSGQSPHASPQRAKIKSRSAKSTSPSPRRHRPHHFAEERRLSNRRLEEGGFTEMNKSSSVPSPSKSPARMARLVNPMPEAGYPRKSRLHWRPNQLEANGRHLGAGLDIGVAKATAMSASPSPSKSPRSKSTGSSRSSVFGFINRNSTPPPS